MSITTENPKKSPSLDEFAPSFITDENGNRFPVLRVVVPSAAGACGTAGMTIQDQIVSQVTGKEGAPLVIKASKQIPTHALVALDPTGAPVSFADYIKTLALTQVPAKFQSAERVATGAEETIAHGLAAVPSLVLVSVYDNNAAAFVVSEGAHDATNLKVTATVGAKYKVIAIA